MVRALPGQSVSAWHILSGQGHTDCNRQIVPRRKIKARELGQGLPMRPVPEGACTGETRIPLPGTFCEDSECDRRPTESQHSIPAIRPLSCIPQHTAGTPQTEPGSMGSSRPCANSISERDSCGRESTKRYMRPSYSGAAGASLVSGFVRQAGDCPGRRVRPPKLVPVQSDTDSAGRGMHHAAAGSQHDGASVRICWPINQKSQPRPHNGGRVGGEHHALTAHVDSCARTLLVSVLQQASKLDI